MSELATLARPYASAAFATAMEREAIERWSHALSLLSDTVQDETVQRLIASPTKTPTQKAEVLMDLFEDQLDEYTRTFVRILAENRRLALIPAIQQEFAARLAQLKRTLAVEITSAISLSDQQIEQFTEQLQSKFQQQIQLTTTVDQSILGGALIRAGDIVLDNTVRGKLDRLRNTLQKT
ncbi:MAG: F0F1 ATP synthase subunit delta [Gammaproteobacteria bacterium]|nr:F0F1 ATP synthase subunit delta [Gammaproteobacteria bacterium]MDE0252055.1 F0F1 ATP synthase subunit delta [Gammaproteobacteria bacterium]MDE0402836.1 F0F1 ATP synthase subunit delta [Gammaproteobacteria bacterium]